MSDEIRKLLIEAYKQKNNIKEEKSNFIFQDVRENTEIVMLDLWKEAIWQWLNFKEETISVTNNYFFPGDFNYYGISKNYFCDLLSIRDAKEYNSKNPNNRIVFISDNKIEYGLVKTKPIFYDELIKLLIKEGFVLEEDQDRYKYFKFTIETTKFEEIVNAVYSGENVSEKDGVKRKILEDK